MNQEQVIELAFKAGFVEYELDDGTTDAFDKRYEKFAALVEAAEREACAKVCEEYRDAWLKGFGRYEFMGEGADFLADFIRARGETK